MTMSCERTRESLSLYIDCKLDDQAMQQVGRHLETCIACRSEFESMLEIIGVLKDLPEIPLPAGFDGRLRQELIKESKWLKGNHQPGYVQSGKEGRKLAPVNWKRVSGVAAIFLVVLIGAGLYNQGFFNQIHKHLYLAGESREAEDGEPDSADLFARIPPSEENSAENQDAFAAGFTGNEPSDENTQNVYGAVDDAAQGVQKSSKAQAAHDTESAPAEGSGGEQGDRGNSSQRQLPEEEDTVSTEAALMMKSLAESSPNYQTVEARLRDTFSLDLVDPGTLIYSLVRYVKTDENTEVFMYNISGTKNGLPAAAQISIQAGVNGIYVLPGE